MTNIIAIDKYISYFCNKLKGLYHIKDQCLAI